jgi:hypothetical protein
MGPSLAIHYGLTGDFMPPISGTGRANHPIGMMTGPLAAHTLSRMIRGDFHCAAAA